MGNKFQRHFHQTATIFKSLKMSSGEWRPFFSACVKRTCRLLQKYHTVLRSWYLFEVYGLSWLVRLLLIHGANWDQGSERVSGLNIGASRPACHFGMCRFVATFKEKVMPLRLLFNNVLFQKCQEKIDIPSSFPTISYQAFIKKSHNVIKHTKINA